ncbi:hypothetical protein V491_08503 [Pseudogymnoascus sp. VKM F-3775]|nr:hypothetical protein V491_08503 [Pseudogymnoascus sp. VKM F-3775]
MELITRNAQRKYTTAANTKYARRYSSSMPAVGEDDFRGHATEYESHGEAEEDEVVLGHQRGVGGEQPCADGGEGDLGAEESENDDSDPDVTEGYRGEGGREEGGPEEVGEGLRPDGGPEVASEYHDHAGDYETLSWAVNDA